MQVYPKRNTSVQLTKSLFGREKVIIAVVQSKPLPGSPDYNDESMDDIYTFAVEEAKRYSIGGVHAIIVENHGDIPFLKPNDIGYETPAFMSIIAKLVADVTSLPIGINVLANGALPAMAIAKASNAKFIRVNQWANAYIANEGLIEGEAAKVSRYRSWIGAKDIKVFADVHVKHGAHAIVADRSIEELTKDAEFFGADAVIATGQRTGDTATYEELEIIKNSTSLPVFVGSGVNKDNVAEILSIADGVIISSSLKKEGVWWNEVDTTRLDDFMKAVRIK